MSDHPRRRKDYQRPYGRYVRGLVPPGWKPVPDLPGVFIAPIGTPPPGRP